MVKSAFKSNQLPFVILVSGLPCTGKTTIATKIAQHFDLPFIMKDDIKERLFDTVGSGDWKISKTLSYATFSILDYVVESMLEANTSFIVEGNFSSDKVLKTFSDYQQRHAFQSVAIECQTEGTVLLERFRKRTESGERHPGHMDRMLIDEMEDDLLRGRPEDSVRHPGQTIKVDTTHFEEVDIEAVIKKIRTHLNHY